MKYSEDPAPVNLGQRDLQRVHVRQQILSILLA